MYNTQAAVFGPTFCPTYVAVTGVTATGATTFTATPVGTAAAIGFCIKGKAYTKATISGGATPTTDAITGAAFLPLAASRACNFVLGLDSGGNIKAAQGTIVTLDPSGNLQADSEFPFLPDTMCPFAYITCKNGSTGSAWTFGSSNWNATGMTATPVSVMALPARPQAT
jgi:hypothetical protein